MLNIFDNYSLLYDPGAIFTLSTGMKIALMPLLYYRIRK